MVILKYCINAQFCEFYNYMCTSPQFAGKLDTVIHI